MTVRGTPGRQRAVVLVCALGMCAAPAVGAAHAAPREPKPADGKSGGQQSDNRRLTELRNRIERLHSRAESATEAYNAAEEQTDRQQKQIVQLARKVDATQQRLKKLNRTAGAMARAQYRTGGMPREAQLVLRDDPEGFLHDASLARKGQQAVKGFLTELTGTRKALSGYTKSATAKWKTLDANRKRKAAAKKKIEQQLKSAEQIESRLAAKERAQLRKLEEQDSYQRQTRWLRSGALKGAGDKASASGRKALAYATKQLGKDYEWGAEGPGTFDCSGLTLRAWQAAGEQLPRTSQEQWKQLKRVPVQQMRPGDLIIFKKDASHVGMYVGDGAMVHAPRTGRQITVEGAGSLPIRGVVRPDG